MGLPLGRFTRLFALLVRVINIEGPSGLSSRRPGRDLARPPRCREPPLPTRHAAVRPFSSAMRAAAREQFRPPSSTTLDNPYTPRSGIMRPLPAAGGWDPRGNVHFLKPDASSSSTSAHAHRDRLRAGRDDHSLRVHGEVRVPRFSWASRPISAACRSPVCRRGEPRAGCYSSPSSLDYSFNGGPLRALPLFYAESFRMARTLTPAVRLPRRRCGSSCRPNVPFGHHAGTRTDPSRRSPLPVLGCTTSF